MIFTKIIRGFISTQHGTFEKHDIKGKHLGEFDIEGNMTKPAGNHKLNIK